MADENKKTEENADKKEEKKDIKEISKEPKPTPEEKIEEPEEPKEEVPISQEKIEEEPTKEVTTEETTEPVEEKEEKIEITAEEEKEAVPEEELPVEAEEEVTEEALEKEMPIETKPPKEDKKPEKKKDEKKDDFKYIIRIANTDVDGEKTVVMGLTQIKGIGRHMAVLIADTAGINRTIKVGDLKDAQIDKIRDVLENLTKNAPGWMLNHRKDLDTGEDIHLISSDVEMKLRDDVNLLKMIRSYRGIRHESGLRVRGQRTRANNRRGLALGVSKKQQE